MWGTQLSGDLQNRIDRFIPTHVGNTSEVSEFRLRKPVHPHACGEHSRTGLGGRGESGSSPRMWGTRLERHCGSPLPRFIPTHVGNTQTSLFFTHTNPVHPHACGEHLKLKMILQFQTGSSPRMWGTHRADERPLIHVRFIPTHVGNTTNVNLQTNTLTVHPHACGEHLGRDPLSLPISGSSPRMWGTLIIVR